MTTSTTTMVSSYDEAFALLPRPPYLPDDPGPGWLQIVARMCERLAATSSPPVIAQVKEKFGELRVYHDGVITEEQKAIVAEAVAEASTTCQICSAPAQRRSRHGWVQTVCDACCAKAYQES